MTDSALLPPGWRKPDLALILAATPRSGSTMLARLVDSTGLFLRTTEYFNDGFYRQRGLGRPLLASKLQEMDRRSRTPANFVSTKLFPEQMIDLMEGGAFETAFQRASYVYISRRDLLGQAISMVRAAATQRWLSNFQGNGKEAEYDGSAITRELLALSAACQWWQMYFATHDVPVLHVVYEMLEADPAAEVGRVVSFLGFDPATHPVDMAKLDIERQRDEVSEEWRRRYLASRPDMEFHGAAIPAARNFKNLVRFLKGKLYAYR